MLNSKGYNLTQIIVTVSIVITIVIGITGFTKILNDNIESKKMIINSATDTITNVSNYIYNTGGIYYTDETIDENGNITSPSGVKNGLDLKEDYNLSLELSEKIFGNSLTGTLFVKLDDDKVNKDSFLGFDINNTNKNIPDYSFDNGLIIYDTSYWTDSEQQTKIKEQLDLLNEQKYKELGDFIQDQSANLNKPGTFIIYDLGKSIYINNFSFNYSTNTELAKKPKLISLTFDNGVKYNFSLNSLTNDHKLTFMDTKTRFIKIDYLLSNDGEFNFTNSINGGLDLLTNNNINYSGTGSNQLHINFNSISNSNVKYYKIFFSQNNIKPDNPTITVPQKAGNIDVYYDISNLSVKPKFLWIDICGINNICKEHDSLNPKQIIY